MLVLFRQREKTFTYDVSSPVVMPQRVLSLNQPYLVLLVLAEPLVVAPLEVVRAEAAVD